MVKRMVQVRRHLITPPRKELIEEPTLSLSLTAKSICTVSIDVRVRDYYDFVARKYGHVRGGLSSQDNLARARLSS